VLQKPISVLSELRASGSIDGLWKRRRAFILRSQRDIECKLMWKVRLVADFVPTGWTAAANGVHSDDALDLS